MDEDRRNCDDGNPGDRLRTRALRTLLCGLLLYALAHPLPLRAEDDAAIRFQAPAVESWMEAYYAVQTGRFEKADLKVSLDIPVSAANILTSVATEQADIGIAATTAIGQAIAGGMPLVVIAPAALSTTRAPVDAVCVRKDSPIKGAKDLEGKTIGIIGLRQFGDVAIRTWMLKGGADIANIKVVQAPFSAMGVGLERGTYDAAVITEPALTYALKNNPIRCIGHPDFAIANEFLLGEWVTNKDYLAKHPDLVKRVAAVLVETGRWANAHQNESAVLVSKLTKIDLELIHAEASRTLYGDSLDPALMQAPLDAALRFHFLTRKVTAAEMLGK